MPKPIANHCYLQHVWVVPLEVAEIMRQPSTAELEELADLWIKFTKWEIRRQRDAALRRGEIRPHVEMVTPLREMFVR